VEITGAGPPVLSQAAVCRLICSYVIAQLEDKSLIEACHILSDIYTLQIDQHAAMNAPPPPSKRRRIAASPKIGRRERTPFLFNDV